MLGAGIGSEICLPLGDAIVGGLLLSPVLALFTTPVVYIYMEPPRPLARMSRRIDLLAEHWGSGDPPLSEHAISAPE